MPASSISLYHMHDSRVNFDAMRPAPVCPDANQLMGQCQNIHVSTNCYYGYHDLKSHANSNVNINCEMMEIQSPTNSEGLRSSTPGPVINPRKRNADDNFDLPNTKRLREETQKEKTIEPEITEKPKLDSSAENLLESLYWHIHGGQLFQIL